jgi:hypothetical protein
LFSDLSNLIVVILIENKAKKPDKIKTKPNHKGVVSEIKKFGLKVAPNPKITKKIAIIKNKIFLCLTIINPESSFITFIKMLDTFI